MSEPWFEPNTFRALYEAIGGGVGGTLMGCFGGLAGYLAPKGKGRRFVLGTMFVLAILGLIQLGIGLVALLTGQPYDIWYPMVLVGGIMTVVIWPLVPVVRHRYTQAEHRRMEAEAIRNS